MVVFYIFIYRINIGFYSRMECYIYIRLCYLLTTSIATCWHAYILSIQLSESPQPNSQLATIVNCGVDMVVRPSCPGSIPKRPMNQNGPREGQKRPIAKYKTAHVDVQNGPQLYPKWPTRMSKTAHRPKRHRRKRTINFRYIQNGLLTAKWKKLR